MLRLALFVPILLAQPTALSAGEQEPVAPDLSVQPSEPAWTPPVLHALTMFTVIRGAEAVLWPDPFAETSPDVWGQHYRDAFTKRPLFDTSQPAFSWDGDRWEINVIGHGLMGSELYLRARQCRFGWAGSFAFTAGASAVWEYGFEGNGVQPSGQDLMLTPLSGLIFGEARYQLWRSADGIAQRPLRILIRTVVDPFGEFERGVGIFDC